MGAWWCSGDQTQPADSKRLGWALGGAASEDRLEQDGRAEGRVRDDLPSARRNGRGGEDRNRPSGWSRKLGAIKPRAAGRKNSSRRSRKIREIIARWCASLPARPRVSRCARSRTLRRPAGSPSRGCVVPLHHHHIVTMQALAALSAACGRPALCRLGRRVIHAHQFAALAVCGFRGTRAKSQPTTSPPPPSTLPPDSAMPAGLRLPIPAKRGGSSNAISLLHIHGQPLPPVALLSASHMVPTLVHERCYLHVQSTVSSPHVAQFRS